MATLTCVLSDSKQSDKMYKIDDSVHDMPAHVSGHLPLALSGTLAYA